jgi:Flp pilus assembly protein TadD
VETLVNLAAAERRLGDDPAARVAVEQALRLSPNHPRALQSLGALRLEDGDADGAAQAFDSVLAVQPQNPLALQGRGQVEAERGGDAAPWFARARALAPQDPALALAEANAFQRAGELATAAGRLEALVTMYPDFADAHLALSRLRWQAGDADGFTASFETALRDLPENPHLWLGLFAALMRARPAAVLERLDAARAALGAVTDSVEAAAASETGDLARADAAFARVDVGADPGLRLAYMRHLLRAMRPDKAAAFAFDAAQRLGDAAAWPYVATAWRLTGDPRRAWLEGDPAFIRHFDLPLSAAELAALGDVLRGLHVAREAPFDQTLRGGTQTEGALLARREPEIRRLKAALSEAVADYIAGLPAADPTHPLLAKPRDGFRFAGSWSVRLTGAGFHVNHVHTTGWLSSAFYVALPDEVADEASKPGWLTFGEPPAELGLAIEPFRLIQPKPGRLALFPSTLWHGTRPFTEGERLTVAFDVVPGDGPPP